MACFGKRAAEYFLCEILFSLLFAAIINIEEVNRLEWAVLTLTAAALMLTIACPCILSDKVF